ncbi:MAG: WD40 repeat domain-containing protein [Thermoguttaceae bacterium]
MEGWSEKYFAFSPDGSMIASSYGRSGDIHVRDSATGKLLRTLRGHKEAATALAFSPDSKRLAGGGVDSSVIVWDLDGDRKVPYRGHVGAITTVGFSPDGRSLVTAGADRTVRLWDATRGQGPRVLPGTEPRALVAVPSPDGSRIAVVRSQVVSMTIILVDAESGREIHQLRSLPLYNGFANAILVRVSPDGRWIASTDGKTVVKVHDAKTGQERATLTNHPSQVTALGFDPDGKRLAVGFGEQIKIWSWAEGREVASIAGRVYPSALAFSRDGSKLAVVGTGRFDAATRLPQPGFGQVWEVASGKLLFNLPGNNLPTVAVAFSPDRSMLATSSWDQTARLVDASNGKELFALRGHSSYVSAVGFSPDGSRLVTGSFDNTVKLWDVASGQETLELGGEIGVVGVSFTTDGRRILAVGGDGKVRAWEGN